MSKSRTEKQNKFKLKPLAVVALALCAIVVIYTATTAWLTGAPLNPVRLASLGDFSYQTNIYFDQGGGSTVSASGYTTTTGITLSTNPAAVNYVGKLRCEITQSGNGVAFTRVKITHEWHYTAPDSSVSRLQGDLNLPFIINTTDFKDNRSSDNYLYYKGTLSPNETVTVISGFDGANFDTSSMGGLSGTIRFSLNITVDAVQFNRYKQVWGIDALPQ